MVIEGGCHCGHIELRFHWPGSDDEIPVRACSCTFCRKHGAVYTSHPEGRLEAWVADGPAVSHYSFGHQSADFFVCARCGVIAFATSTIEGRVYAVVNVKTFEGVDPSVLVSRVTDFDGETPAERLGRRQRNWTPRVELHRPPRSEGA